MNGKNLSERLQQHISSIEEGTAKKVATGIGSSAMLGAGLGGAAKMAGYEGAGMMAGAKVGAKVGVTAALIVGGSLGIANLIKKARENGASETKSAIKKAVARAQESKKLTNTQKAAVRNNGQMAIAKIDQTFKKQYKHESLENGEEGTETKDMAAGVDDTMKESLGKSILERLNAISEEGNMKKAAAAGAIGGAVAGHQITKHNARKEVARAVNNRKSARDAVKAAAQNTKAAVNKSGAAKTILNKESRLAGQLQKKNPSGLVDKLKNHGAKLAQKGRVKAAADNVASHPDVAKALTKQYKAQDKLAKSKEALASAKKALRKVGRTGGGLKGAAIGAAVGAGSYGLLKLANKANKK